MALFTIAASAQNKWYTQGNFDPATRLEFTVENQLNIVLPNSPVVVLRRDFPIPDIHEMWITVVDPALPSKPEPTKEMLDRQGGHLLRGETNGASIFHQIDDLDKDGIWDELFFQVSLKPKEKRTIYVYMGENIRGWNEHYTHANIGSYCRHQMPFWESEHVGWKIWFANSVDVFAKRKPLLMSHRLYMGNLDGYGVAYENEDYGSDIQSVDISFGASSICLFEFPDKPDSVTRPRFTPTQRATVPKSHWNAGQISDTRYAYEVITNGPIRSMIRIKGMNWDSGNGFYEYEQVYTAYARQSYCASKVTFTTFNPRKLEVLAGCGMRKKPREDNFVQEGGLVISSGAENIKDPEMIDDRDQWSIPFIGGAIVVKDKYKPEYQFIKGYRGNHAFRVTPNENHTFEYMVLNAWSEGEVYNNKDLFNAYVRKSAQEFNNPAIARFVKVENR